MGDPVFFSRDRLSFKAMLRQFVTSCDAVRKALSSIGMCMPVLNDGANLFMKPENNQTKEAIMSKKTNCEQREKIAKRIEERASGGCRFGWR